MCPVPLRCDISFLFALALLSVRMAGPFVYGRGRSGWDWEHRVQIVKVLSYFRIRKGACDRKSPTARLGQQADSFPTTEVVGMGFLFGFQGGGFFD